MKSSPNLKKPSHAKRLVGFVVVLAAASAAGAFYSRDPGEPVPPASVDVPREKVTLALGREPLAALALIALEQKFFENAGLDVTVKKYNSSNLALKSLLAGEAELAASTDIPIAFESLSRQDFRIVATIGSADNEPRIVARRDSGIQTPADLRGKRVATQKSSAAHFFLHMFLLQNGLTAADVQLSFMQPDELARALVNGDVDAFCNREPFVAQATRRLGDKAVVFMQPGLYRKTFNVVARNEVLTQRPQIVQRALQALMRAEAFARERPEEARAMLARGLELQPAEVAQAWQDATLMVSLDQSLRISLEDQAKWIIASQLSNAVRAPDYLDLIHVGALKAVNPITVSLIH